MWVMGIVERKSNNVGAIVYIYIYERERERERVVRERKRERGNRPIHCKSEFLME